MTFEEFFNKKRIDLGLMRDADPALYSEFKSHFESMGEKSFDHTKKFWFNKLRHLYHLAEPAKKVVTQMETQIVSQAEPLKSPTIEQGSAVTQSGSEQQAKSSGLPKPGFRPRSIPPAAVKAADAPPMSEPDAPADKPATPVSKPGFRPRNVKPVSGELSEDAQNTASRPGQDMPSGASQGNEANISRPAYKPRFNAGKVVSETTPSENQSQSEKNIEGQVEDATTPGGQDGVSTPPAADTISKEGNEVAPPVASSASKPAYKPRFNVKTIAQKHVEEADAAVSNEPGTSTEEAADASSAIAASDEAGNSKIEANVGEKDVSPTDEAKTVVPKPAYKPRFNAKNIVPKADEEPPVLSPDENQAKPDGSSEKEVKSAEESLDESPKPSYKPRFNIKNIKPKE